MVVEILSFFQLIYSDCFLRIVGVYCSFPHRNMPCSIYQYSNMAPRFSGETSIFGVVFFVSETPSTRIRKFSNPQLFLSGYGYRPHISSEFDSESGKQINPLSRVEKNISATNPITCGRRQSGKNKSATNPITCGRSQSGKNKSVTNPITCGRVNPDIFLSDDVKNVFSLSPNNNPIWRHNVEGEQSKFLPLPRSTAHALKTF